MEEDTAEMVDCEIFLYCSVVSIKYLPKLGITVTISDIR